MIKTQKYKNNFIINSRYFNQLELLQIELWKKKISASLEKNILSLFSINLNRFLFTDIQLEKLLKDRYLTDIDIDNFIDRVLFYQ